jgi:hypothetical protein
LNFVQRIVADDITRCFSNVIARVPPDRKVMIDYDSLMNCLNFIERDFARRIVDIDPGHLGFTGSFYSLDRPKDIVKISSVIITSGNEKKVIGVQYCASRVYSDFLRMNEQMKNDIGKTVYIENGYNSAGFQAYLFFNHLVNYSNYSLTDNIKQVLMPGFCQNNNPLNNAIDLCTENGLNCFPDSQNAAKFDKLPEFKWLMENAYKFNFYLSYPLNNKYGAAYEPWHWYWERKHKSKHEKM